MRLPDITNRPDDALYDRVAQIIEAARARVSRTVNSAMVQAYWLIGREIVEVEQAGDARAEYGKQLIVKLAGRLSMKFGKGFGPRTLRRVRQFYLTYPEGSNLPPELGGPEKRSALLSETGASEIRSALLTKSSSSLVQIFPSSLGWSHYLILIRVDRPQARAFYEIEATRENWTTREMERQIASLLFERLTINKDQKEILALAKRGQEVSSSSDVIKDPFVLEFLDLKEKPSAHEHHLEQAIIDRLEEFLLEIGKGFCFVARQKRITLEGDHFYVDLVFYNRLLRCFVLVDLKIGKLTHQDLGQIQMYVNFFDRHQRIEGEAPTVGIVLCSEKNEAMVQITLPENNAQIHTSRYQLYLPTEEQLRKELVEERERLEQARRLSGAEESEQEDATSEKGTDDG